MKLQREIQELVKQQQYAEALSHFKEVKSSYEQEEISKNEYLTANMLTCMRKINDFRAAESYLQIYQIKIDDNTSDRIVTSWLLVLYDWYKAIYQQNDNKLKQLIEKITHTLQIYKVFHTEFGKSIYNNIVRIVIRAEGKRQQINWLMIRKFCEAIQVEHLDTSCYVFTSEHKGKQRETELASLQEEWYVLYSKSLFELKQYDQCIEICESALNQITKFHYSNDIWFSRRIAQSLLQLGNNEEAIARLEKIIKRKNDWFLLAELGFIHLKTGDYAKARSLMCTALMKPGEFRYKVELIEQTGDIYHQLEEIEMASMHYQLAYAIRKAEEWSLDNELQQKLGNQVSTEDCVAEQKRLRGKLKQEWQKHAQIEEVRKHSEFGSRRGKVSGEIIRISKPKEAGVDVWIQASDGSQLYAFIKKEETIYASIKVGLQVQFHIKPQADKPLNRAIHIQVAQP